MQDWAVPPLPVARPETQFRTRQHDAAIAFMESLYGPHALSFPTRGPLDLRVAGIELGRLNLSEVTYGAPARAALLAPRPYWVFSQVIEGHIRVGDSEAGPGAAGALAPDALSGVPMSADFRLRNLRVPSEELHDACALLLGHPPDRPLALPDRVSDDSPMARVLSSVMSRLAQTPAYSHPGSAALERRLQEAALFELLMVWPHPYSDALLRPMTLPEAIRRARDYLDAHAIDLPTLGDVARVAGIGVRALTRGFARHLGTTPMRYAAHCRLERARRALQDQVGGRTVTQIALDCGFTHLGEFALRYRARYGESPSRTLRGR